jgi:hypothetical protein
MHQLYFTHKSFDKPAMGLLLIDYLYITLRIDKGKKYKLFKSF